MIDRVLRYEDIPKNCRCTWTFDDPAASPLYRRYPRRPGFILPPCPVHPDEILAQTEPRTDITRREGTDDERE